MNATQTSKSEILRRRRLDQAARERAALLSIINAANGYPDPIHYQVREAIDRARSVIQFNDGAL